MKKVIAVIMITLFSLSIFTNAYWGEFYIEPLMLETNISQLDFNLCYMDSYAYDKDMNYQSGDIIHYKVGNKCRYIKAKNNINSGQHKHPAEVIDENDNLRQGVNHSWFETVDTNTFNGTTTLILDKFYVMENYLRYRVSDSMYWGVVSNQTGKPTNELRDNFLGVHRLYTAENGYFYIPKEYNITGNYIKIVELKKVSKCRRFKSDDPLLNIIGKQFTTDPQNPQLYENGKQIWECDLP